MNSFLINQVKKFSLDQNLLKKGDRVIIAVSGGPDSVCLFDILHRIRKDLDLTLAIAHYNHRQRGIESDSDEKFVAKLGKDRGVEVFIGKNKSTNKISENEARDLRYDFFEKILGEWSGDRLVIAHTANDQAETFLMRAIRGAGILGLSAIPLRRKKIVRPLLKFTRKEILDYLNSHNIKYQIDKSNYLLDVFRNQIRHKILPILLEIDTKSIINISSSVERLAEEEALLEEFVEKYFTNVAIKVLSSKISIDRTKISALSPAMQKQVVRFALRKIDASKDVSNAHYLMILGLISKNIGNKTINPNKHLQVSLNKGIINIVKKDQIKAERNNEH